MIKKTITRGDMFYVDFGQALGSEQGNHRPAIVLQNNIGNKFSPTVLEREMMFSE